MGTIYPDPVPAFSEGSYVTRAHMRISIHLRVKVKRIIALHMVVAVRPHNLRTVQEALQRQKRANRLRINDDSTSKTERDASSQL